MTRRVPEMRPSAKGGRGVPHALDEVLRVTPDGGVEVRGPRPVRLPPGAVRRAVHLGSADGKRLLPGDAYYGGTLVLVGEDGPLLATQVLDWTPPTPVSAADLLRTSGTLAVCRALEVPLETAEPADLVAFEHHDLRRCLVRPGPVTLWPGRWSLAIGGLAVLLALVSSRHPRSAAGFVPAVVALVLAAGVVLLGARGRLQARAAGARAVPTGQAVVISVRPSGRVHRGLLDHFLQISPEELLLRRHGTVVRLPGPVRGGVAQAIFEPLLVRLADSDGRNYAALETSLWCADETARAALREQLSTAGLEVLNAPLDSGTIPDTGDTTTGRFKPSDLRSCAERGDVAFGAPGLGFLSATLAALGGAASVSWNAAAGLPVLAAGLLLAGVALGFGGLRRRQDQRAIQLVDVPAKQGALHL